MKGMKPNAKFAAKYDNAGEQSESGQERSDRILVRIAYEGIFPDREFNFFSEISYSDKFSDYNANVKYGRERMIFGLSKKWITISDEIKIGLLQSLMQKIFRVRRDTLNIDL